MTVLQRIQREPAAALAFCTAILAILTAAGVLEEGGAAGALGLVSAGIGFLRYVVTPSSEVVVQELPGGTTVAGPASPTASVILNGVRVKPSHDEPGEHRRDDEMGGVA